MNGKYTDVNPTWVLIPYHESDLLVCEQDSQVNLLVESKVHLGQPVPQDKQVNQDKQVLPDSLGSQVAKEYLASQVSQEQLDRLVFRDR